MAKKKEEVEETQLDLDQTLMDNFLKGAKDDHYNYLEEKYYRVSTGSLILDYELNGGLPPGLHRCTGINAGGKTRFCLDILDNFLKEGGKRKGIFIEAEGRLSKEAREQHGITYVYDPKEWVDGTCFILQSNKYEFVAEVIENIVVKQNTDVMYCIILDSVDGLKPKDSFSKSYEDSAKVAGGAVIASTLMSRIAIPLGKKGHIALFISQVRSDIQLNPYGPKEIRQIASTGGNALLHYANYILEFEARFGSDRMIKDPKKPPSPENPIEGHMAKITIKKSPNDKNEMRITYPIKYGRKNGSAIWIEKEIVDFLMMWQEIERGGSWYSFNDTVHQYLIDNGCEIDQKYQGIEKLYSAVENSECAVSLLKDYIYENLMA